jgi:DNA modification methylase
VTIHVGDVRKVLPTLPDASVQCCITSPPYFGLRDYGVGGQMGLEASPEAYVDAMVGVFREVRRVLRDDGTLWLNLGDSYASSTKGSGGKTTKQVRNAGAFFDEPRKFSHDVKDKDLLGVPWRVAFTLQQPYYTGAIKNESDRVWMAAMLDAEGCITASEYETGGRLKTNIYLGITNSSVPIIDKCERLFPQEVQHVYEKDGTVNKTVYRWDVERMEQKSLFLRELYPYLVAKRKQAILGYTFTEMQKGLVSKKKGYVPEQQEQRTWLVKAMSRLNQGEDVDLPDWVIEPPSLFEPGFYLRQDIIWAKPNPMPESVKDRCTKAHEYVFLLAKAKRYYYDAEAIKEPAVEAGKSSLRKDTGKAFREVHADHGDGMRTRPVGRTCGNPDMRNKRSVWTVVPKPFKGAHFAVMPEALVEPCLLAGTPTRCCSACGAGYVRQVTRPRVATRPGTDTKTAGTTAAEHGNRDPERHVTTTETTGFKPGCKCDAAAAQAVVLDPFAGAGTVGVVAKRHGREFVGVELNPEYAKIARERINA